MKLLISTIIFLLTAIVANTTLPTEAIAMKPVLIQSFSDVYEPSAVIQIGPARVLIIEDDGSRPLISASITQGKKGLLLTPDRLARMTIPVDDFEGAAVGKAGKVFLITSHTPTKRGKYKPARQRLLQIKVKGKQSVSLNHADTLLPSIKLQLTKIHTLNHDELKNINIEGLSFDPNREKLLLGLRAPLHNKKSIILTLENPYSLVERGQLPTFSSDIIMLDMHGGGIRAMVYDHILGIYLIVNEVKNKKGKLRSRLWAWDGRPDHPPSRVRLPKMKGIKNIEGITPIQFNGSHYLLLVCDDGNKKKQKGAHYIFINSRDISF